jgi:hypothetical protein
MRPSLSLLLLLVLATAAPSLAKGNKDKDKGNGKDNRVKHSMGSGSDGNLYVVVDDFALDERYR